MGCDLARGTHERENNMLRSGLAPVGPRRSSGGAPSGQARVAPLCRGIAVYTRVMNPWSSFM
jgi:hypothetical protein